MSAEKGLFDEEANLIAFEEVVCSADAEALMGDRKHIALIGSDRQEVVLDVTDPGGSQLMIRTGFADSVAKVVIAKIEVFAAFRYKEGVVEVARRLSGHPSFDPA